MVEARAQANNSIDEFENPFLGLEFKMQKNLGESKVRGYTKAEGQDQNQEGGEHQMFETFVKEKATLLGYVHDLVRFAAKIQEIDLVQAGVF